MRQKFFVSIFINVDLEQPLIENEFIFPGGQIAQFKDCINSVLNGVNTFRWLVEFFQEHYDGIRAGCSKGFTAKLYNRSNVKIF